MTHFLLIVSAGGLASLSQKRLGLAGDFAPRMVLTCAWLVLLGLACVLLGMYSLLAPLALLLPGALLLLRYFRPPASTDSAPLTPAEWLCAALIVAPAALACAALRVPVIQTHENTGLLTLLKNYAAESRLYFDPLVPESGAPHFGHALTALSLADYLPGLGAWFFALLGLAVLYALARHFLERTLALLATAAFACSPMFLQFASQPSLHSLFFLFALAAMLALTLHCEQPHPVWLVCAGILCGAACGVYHLGYLLLLLLAVTHLAALRKPGHTGAFVLVALLAATPWLLRSCLLTGNPVYPAFQAWFPSTSLAGPFIPYLNQNPELSGTFTELLLAYLRFPWQAVMQPQDFTTWPLHPGIFAFSFALPALVLGTTRTRLLLLFALLGGASCYFFTPSIYLLALFIALLTLAAAASLERFPGKGRVVLRGLALAMISTSLLMQFVLLYQDRGVLLGRESRDAYFARHIGHFAIFTRINSDYNDGGAVLLAEPRTWYLDPPAIFNPWELRRLASEDAGMQDAWLEGNNVRYLLLPENLPDTDAANLLRRWAGDSRRFELVENISYPNLTGEGQDRVRLYRRK